MTVIRLNALGLTSVGLDEQDEGLPSRIRVTMPAHKDDGSPAPPAPYRDSLVLHLNPDLAANLVREIQKAISEIRA